jgi:hypothetical protein
MVDVFGVIKRALALVLLFVHVLPAFAAIAPISQAFSYPANSYGSLSNSEATTAIPTLDACILTYEGLRRAYGSVRTNHRMTSATTCIADPRFETFVIQQAPAKLVCTANSTLIGGVCVCDSGFREDGQVCKAFDAKAESDILAAALNYAGFPLLSSGPPKLQVCFSGFVFYGSGAAGNAAGTESEMYPPFTTKGESCTTQSAGGASLCKAGESTGQVNGVDVCIPDRSKINVIESGSTTNVTADSGGAPSVPNAPLGTTTASKETTCTGEACKTVTSFKDSAGAILGTSEKSESKDSFCSENPSASICVVGKWSGTCGAPPVCSGDAVQCAIARASFESSCFMKESPAETTEEGLYGIGKTKTGDQTTGLEGNLSVDVGPSTFSQTEFLGAAVGMADITVSIMGSSVTLPFSSVNVWLERFGLLLVALTFVLCVRIVSRG